MLEYHPPEKIALKGGIYAVTSHSVSQDHAGSVAIHTIMIHVEDGSTYRITIPGPKYTRIFVDKLILAFRLDPVWRENFREIDTPFRASEVVSDEVVHADLDYELDFYQQELINQGHIPSRSFAGDDHPMGRAPYIGFNGSMPPDLYSAAAGAGWITIEGDISPPPIRGQGKLLRRTFLLMLDDWFAGTMDTTGVRYRVQREGIPYLPALPELTKAAMRDHQRTVSKRAQQANKRGEKATFDDMVKLRSGRDLYSNMKLPALREALADDPALQELEELYLDEAVLRRALRWRLRGLDVSMITKKMEVDQVLTSRFHRVDESEPS
ncbi:hypothetical protein ACYPKM_01690 [Pseudomonas aeruginosa]